jgi:predicted transcriptional regulator
VQLAGAKLPDDYRVSPPEPQVKQQKEMLKKLVDLEIQLDEKKATVSQITEQGFEMDDYWKISKLFSIMLDNLDKNERKKLRDHLSQIINKPFDFSTNWNSNTAKIMKILVDLEVMFGSNTTYKNIKDQIQMIK